MSMAKAADAPVILVGDIDLGGVFASLLGTVMLLTEEEQKRVKGIIINKFRGDPSILEPGLRELEEKTGVPVLGVLPYLDVHVEEEDSLYEPRDHSGEVNVAVIRLPRISNATDLFTLLPPKKDLRNKAKNRNPPGGSPSRRFLDIFL